MLTDIPDVLSHDVAVPRAVGVIVPFSKFVHTLGAAGVFVPNPVPVIVTADP